MEAKRYLTVALLAIALGFVFLLWRAARANARNNARNDDAPSDEASSPASSTDDAGPHGQ